MYVLVYLCVVMWKLICGMFTPPTPIRSHKFGHTAIHDAAVASRRPGQFSRRGKSLSLPSLPLGRTLDLSLSQSLLTCTQTLSLSLSVSLSFALSPLPPLRCANQALSICISLSLYACLSLSPCERRKRTLLKYCSIHSQKHMLCMHSCRCVHVSKHMHTHI
jgi:hypothetical protein